MRKHLSNHCGPSAFQDQAVTPNQQKTKRRHVGHVSIDHLHRDSMGASMIESRFA